MAITITDLFIYPVKSLRGIRLERSALDIRGLADDRRWMIIDQQNRFVTQRTLPQLATLHTRLTATSLWLETTGGEIEIPRTPATPDSTAGGTPITARIWNDDVQVLDEGDAVSQWLTHAVNHPTPLRLVRLSNTPRPQSKPQYLGEAHTVFADMAPLLITNQASLDSLNRALAAGSEAPVPMNRFRPNIVISGLNPFAEHRIARLRHVNFSLALAYPCERCIMTTVDQASGQKHPHMEPYRTLTQVNAMPAYGDGKFHKPANPKAPAFGENALLMNNGTGNATLLVGDRLWVDRLR